MPLTNSPESKLHNQAASCILQRAKLPTTLCKGVCSPPMWCPPVSCSSYHSSLGLRPSACGPERSAVLFRALKIRWLLQNSHSPSAPLPLHPCSQKNSAPIITTPKTTGQSPHVPDRVVTAVRHLSCATCVRVLHNGSKCLRNLIPPVSFVAQPCDHVISVTRPSPCRTCSGALNAPLMYPFNVIDVICVLHSPLLTPPLENPELGNNAKV
jgi:hypothetical protein